MTVQRGLSLVLPGLLGPVRGVPRDRVELGEPLPAAAALLSRASCRRGPGDGVEGSLAALFGVTGRLAAGRLGYRADTGHDPDCQVLRADPVHLQAGMTDLTQVDAAELALREDETASLVAAFNRTYAPEGLELRAPVTSRWYLLAASPLDVSTAPLTSTFGAPLRSLLPGGADGARLRGLLTEVQMLFTSHEVNQRREAEGRPPVNGIWVWGEGDPEAATSSPWSVVYADDGLARAMATHAGAEVAAVPDDAATCLAGGAGGRALVYLDPALRPARRGVLEDWLQALGYLEREWLGPLQAALRSRELDVVELIPLSGRRYRVTRRALARVWRRRRPLAAFLEADA